MRASLWPGVVEKLLLDPARDTCLGSFAKHGAKKRIQQTPTLRRGLYKLHFTSPRLLGVTQAPVLVQFGQSLGHRKQVRYAGYLLLNPQPEYEGHPFILGVRSSPGTHPITAQTALSLIIAINHIHKKLGLSRSSWGHTCNLQDARLEK